MKNQNWWGDFDFAMDAIKRWKFGDRFIAIQRSAHEWTVWDNTTSQEESVPITVEDIVETETFEGVDFSRYVVSESKNILMIEPSLADRAMIVRPNKPFSVLPQQEITVYVSTPVWMTILLKNSDVPMADIPFWRPSDSWFGKNTMHGDICYSKYTEAKLNDDVLEIKPHRAKTMVTIKNALNEPLKIERLNLPVPALKLYVTSDGFWTDQVSIVQTLEHGKSVSHLRHFRPQLIEDLRLVSESRVLSKKSSLLSSIKSLID